MIKNLKKIAEFKIVKRLLSNFLSLSVLEIVNYIIPLLLIPYVLRIFGIDKFGEYMFAQSFVQYFAIIVDFGFNFIATRDIAINRKDKKTISKIFSSVFFAKILLLSLSFLIFIIIIVSFDKFKDIKLFVLTFGIVFGQMLFPIFLYQGLEKMKSMMILNVVPKILVMCMIFFFVKGMDDFYTFIFLMSFAYILSGILGFFYAIKKNYTRLHFVSLVDIKFFINKSKDVFLANSSSTLYLTSNTFILGLFSNSYGVVGYYSVAEKIVRVSRYVFKPLTQTLFPFYSQKFSKQNVEDSKKDILKFIYIITPFLILVIFILVCNMNLVIEFIYGESNSRIYRNVQIMIIVILIGTYNNILGVLGFINLGLEKEYKNIMFIIGGSNLLLITIMSFYYEDLGASIVFVLSEVILFLFLRSKFLKKNY